MESVRYVSPIVMMILVNIQPVYLIILKVKNA